MTVSSIGEIEGCPRRWALTAADYPQLWKGRGYPPRLQGSAMEGTVIHSVLETILRGLGKSNCISVDDPSAIQLMKGLGGYTKLIEQSIDKALDPFRANPRSVGLIDDVSVYLYSRTPQIRNRVQALLSRRSIQSVPSSRTGKRFGGSLRQGLFPEIVLKASQIGWKGKADLVVLSGDTCEIIDFKTGRREEHHAFQLHVYALLWSRDIEANESGRLANRLVLAYPDGDVEVQAPTARELIDIERQLVERRCTAAQTLSRNPPEARPDISRCCYCAVRHLCDEYWSPDVQRTMGGQPEKHLVDIELVIVKKHGPFSWDAKITSSDHLPADNPALLRTSHVECFDSGVRLRVLAATVTVDKDNADLPAVITLGRFSEYYVVV